jgi:hypothetical protein
VIRELLRVPQLSTPANGWPGSLDWAIGRWVAATGSIGMHIPGSELLESLLVAMRRLLAVLIGRELGARAEAARAADCHARYCEGRPRGTRHGLADGVGPEEGRASCDAQERG